jgi:ligand-binding SRPBCC domain-containing protein
VTSRRFRIETELGAPAAEVWDVVSTFDGVNRELGPWMRMTYPAEAQGMGIAQAPLGERMFRSWVLLFGAVPIDYDDICLEQILPGEGFDERSSMLSMRVWEHRRRIRALGDAACAVEDRLCFEPRVPLSGPLLHAVVGRLFRHRHARLVARFGALRS